MKTIFLANEGTFSVVDQTGMKRRAFINPETTFRCTCCNGRGHKNEACPIKNLSQEEKKECLRMLAEDHTRVQAKKSSTKIGAVKHKKETEQQKDEKKTVPQLKKVEKILPRGKTEDDLKKEKEEKKDEQKESNKEKKVEKTSSSTLTSQKTQNKGPEEKKQGLKTITEVNEKSEEDEIEDKEPGTEKRSKDLKRKDQQNVNPSRKGGVEADSETEQLSQREKEDILSGNRRSGRLKKLDETETEEKKEFLENASTSSQEDKGVKGCKT